MILSKNYKDLSVDEYLQVALGEQVADFLEAVTIFRELHHLRSVNRGAYSVLVDTSSSQKAKIKNDKMDERKAIIQIRMMRFQLFESRKLAAKLEPDIFLGHFQTALKMMASKFGADHG